jgi:hypothetical protein
VSQALYVSVVVIVIYLGQKRKVTLLELGDAREEQETKETRTPSQ